MADVQFDEEQTTTRYASTPSQKKGGSVTRLILKLGLAKDERGAQYVMLAIAAICFIIMGFVLFSGGSKPARITPPIQGVPGSLPQ